MKISQEQEKLIETKTDNRQCASERLYKAETEEAETEEEKMSIEEAIICLNDIKTSGRNVFTNRKTFNNVLDMAIRALKMQKELSEFSGMDICDWVEDYDYDENNISEYEYETSVDNFLIDEVNAKTEEGDY